MGTEALFARIHHPVGVGLAEEISSRVSRLIGATSEKWREREVRRADASTSFPGLPARPIRRASCISATPCAPPNAQSQIPGSHPEILPPAQSNESTPRA